jgi:hypothetical protein
MLTSFLEVLPHGIIYTIKKRALDFPKCPSIKTFSDLAIFNKGMPYFTFC